MGGRRGQVLGIASDDPVLAWIGPVGLALSSGTALIIDCQNARLSAGRTLSDIAAEGPRLEELSPARTGVATIAAGDVSGELLAQTVDQLAKSWPALVIRGRAAWAGACVPYRALYPGALAPDSHAPAVWQRIRGGSVGRHKGPVLPPVSTRSVRAMLENRRPIAPRWIREWKRVWELPWA